jgi:hypothetical protein
LAGCGSGGNASPRIPRADAEPLIALADRISHEGPCAQARDIRELDRKRAVLVSARRIPPALADSLSAGVHSLVEQMPVCVPAVARSAPAPPPPPAPSPSAPEDRKDKHDDHGKHDHGHGHGKKHGGDHGDEGGD